MNFLEITVECIHQEDYSGKDELGFMLNGNTIGYLIIGTGDTRTVHGGSTIFYPSDGQGIMISDGDRIQIAEIDYLDPNDQLLDYTVSQDDIDSRSVAMNYKDGNANYNFTLKFA